MRLLRTVMILLAFLPVASSAALFRGPATSATAGLIDVSLDRWPSSLPPLWRRARTSGGIALFLDGVASFARDQRCNSVAPVVVLACGEAALGAFFLAVSDPSLVCMVAPRARPVLTWRPGAPSSADAASDPGPGTAVYALPARCSSVRLADLGSWLIASGHAVPVSGQPDASFGAALRSARSLRVGVWAYSDGRGFLHPSSWISNRLQIIGQATPR